MVIFVKSLVTGVIFVVAGILAYYLASHTPEPVQKSITTAVSPPVDIVLADYQTQSLPVYSRGLVEPGKRVVLVSQVTGTVTRDYESFSPGVPVVEGESLLFVETQALESGLKRAQAQLARAKRSLSAVRAEIEDDRLLPNLRVSRRVRAQQLEEAELELEAAQAQVDKLTAQKDKQMIRAPFDGIIETRSVDVGQTLAEGTEVGRLYATDALKVRLPLSDRDLAVLGINLDGYAALDFDISLKLKFGEAYYFWQGSIDHFEAGLDPKNRLMYLVAKIDQPYAADVDQPNRPILAPGHFLEAEIHGSALDNIMALPRQLLRYGDFVWTLDAEQRLRQRAVDLVYKDQGLAYVRANIEPGTPIVITPLEIAVEGMRVELLNAPEADTRLSPTPTPPGPLDTPRLLTADLAKAVVAHEFEPPALETDTPPDASKNLIQLESVALPPLVKELD